LLFGSQALCCALGKPFLHNKPTVSHGQFNFGGGDTNSYSQFINEALGFRACYDMLGGFFGGLEML
jgi:hypothetical protein